MSVNKRVNKRFSTTKVTVAVAQALACLTVAAPMAYAQTAPSAKAADTGGIEEIVVTARRREEKLQEVPISITAVTGEALAEQGIVSVNALARSVPALTIKTFPGDNTSATLSLRGLNSIDNLISIDPAVGIYLDGVYVARATGGNLGMLDVARVEVLRGPQGTLFGRNTIGGAVSIVTNTPSDKLEGSIQAGIGNFSAYNLEGVLNVPLSDTVAVRVAASHTEHKGYARSSVTGAELNSEDSDFVRGSVSIKPTSDLRILLSGDYSYTQNHGQWVTLGAVKPGGAYSFEALLEGVTPKVDPFNKDPRSTTTGPFKGEVKGASATIEWDAGPGTLKLISAYRELLRKSNGNDLDGDLAAGLQQGSPSSAFDVHATQKQSSHELQYFGTSMDGRLDWIGGLYYFREEGDDFSTARYLPSLLPPVYSITDGSAVNKSVSAFGQIGFKITEQLKLDLGVRHVKDTRDLVLRNRAVLAANFAPIACTVTGASVAAGCRYVTPTGEFSYNPYTVGLNFQATDGLLLYGKYSVGYRSGGTNIRGQSAAALNPFGPEQANTVEVGIKSDLLDRRLRLNASLYQTKYKDIQLTTIVPVGGIATTIIQNAGEAKINGAEVEATARVTNQLTLSGSVAYIDPKYTSIAPAALGNVNLGSKFVMTPKWQYSVAADYEIPLDANTLRLHAGYDWRDDTYFANVPPADSSNIQKAYGLLNARATFQMNNGFEVSVWGSNLGDKKYAVNILNLWDALGYTPLWPGEPRTFGLNVKYKF